MNKDQQAESAAALGDEILAAIPLARAMAMSVSGYDGDSLTLRWDFVEPLLPGEGGLVRFNCRVR